MEESIFKMAVASVLSGEYNDSDIKILKEQLNSLNKKELALKRQMEHSKNEYAKNKNKSQKELDILRKDIKSLKCILDNEKNIE